MAGASITLLDIVTEVLSLLQVYAPGEPIPAEDSASLLFTARGIVNGWQAEPLTIESTAIFNFTTAAAQGSYTLGVGSPYNWRVPFLPPEILNYGALISGNLERGMRPLTDDQWAALGLKTLGSNIALSIWPQYGPTFHTLWLWPVPTGVAPIVLYCAQPVSNFTSISDAVVMRPGYQDAFIYELALKAAPKFGAAAIVPSWLADAWADAKQKIKAANFPILDAACDPAITPRARRSGGGSVDFYLGR